MQRGKDAVGNMAGQILGKAAQYTSELYNKTRGRSSGSLGNLSFDADSSEGGSGELLFSTQTTLCQYYSVRSKTRLAYSNSLLTLVIFTQTACTSIVLFRSGWPTPLL